MVFQGHFGRHFFVLTHTWTKLFRMGGDGKAEEGANVSFFKIGRVMVFLSPFGSIFL